MRRITRPYSSSHHDRSDFATGPGSPPPIFSRSTPTTGRTPQLELVSRTSSAESTVSIPIISRLTSRPSPAAHPSALGPDDAGQDGRGQTTLRFLAANDRRDDLVVLHEEDVADASTREMVRDRVDDASLAPFAAADWSSSRDQ